MSTNTPTTTALLLDSSSIKAIAPQWDELVREDPRACQGLDATSTWCWFDALSASFPAAASSRVVTVRAGDDLMGVLPLVEVAHSPFGSELQVATDLNGGRNGLIIAENAGPDVLQDLLKGITAAFPKWATLTFTLSNQGSDAARFREACKSLGFQLRSHGVEPSPFFPIRTSEEEFRQGVAKNVLQMIRSGSNKAAKIGSLQYRVFEHPADADAFLHAILEIERQSWKHEAGTAITARPQQMAFYSALFPRAMQHGQMFGLVLYLDDRPIAHHFGLIRGKVFSCLKHSNAADFEKLRLGYLLVYELCNRLRERHVETFDFMGRAETHKLQWSTENGLYHRECFTAYSANWRGRGLAAARRLKAALKRAPSATPALDDTKAPS